MAAKSTPKAVVVPVPKPVAAAVPVAKPVVVAAKSAKAAVAKKSASKPVPQPASKPGTKLPAASSALPVPVVPKSVQAPPVKLEPVAISVAARAIEEDLKLSRSKDSAAPARKSAASQPRLPAILLSGDPDPASSRARARVTKTASADSSVSGVAEVGGSQSDTASVFVSAAGAASVSSTPAPMSAGVPQAPVGSGAGGSPAPQHEAGRSRMSQPSPAPVSQPSPVLSGSVWVIARDPFTVCVHWDLPSAVVDAERARSPRGEWRLRLWQERVGGTRISDQPLPLDTTHRFVPVMIPGAGYVAEIGYQEASGQWCGWAISQPVTSPRESFRRERERDRGRGWEADRTTDSDSNSDSVSGSPERAASGPVNPENLLGSISDRSRGAGSRTSGSAPHSRQWVVLEALQRILHREANTVFVGSSERAVEWSETETQIPERRSRVDCGPEPVPAVVPANPSSSSLPRSLPLLSPLKSVSSEAPAATPEVPPAPGFWFRVNAEVILYGSTERDATVTIAGRPVTLREDGSFSFRFLLPDGQFDLPVVAMNAARTDGRSAAVTFARATTIRGDVGVHPAPPELQPPVPSAI